LHRVQDIRAAYDYLTSAAGGSVAPERIVLYGQVEHEIDVFSL